MKVHTNQVVGRVPPDDSVGGTFLLKPVIQRPTERLRRGNRVERWLIVENATRITSRNLMPGDRYDFIDLGRCFRYVWIDYHWRYWLEPGEFVRLHGTVRQIEPNGLIRLHHVHVL